MSSKLFLKAIWFPCLVSQALMIPPLHGASPRGVVSEQGITEIKTLPQNWTDAESSWFYNVPQGSYLLRYEWFLNLEQADSEKPFRDASNIQALGYLARSADRDNPDGLPIGFTKDENPTSGETYVGWNCAACHTGQIVHDGKLYLIDGGPSHGDPEKLLRNLVAALDATLDQEAKFNRFADKVLGTNLTPEIKAKLQTGLQAALEARKGYNDRNLPALMATPFGPGRIDAFGAILNEVAVRFAKVPSNAAPADAPVAFPMLWDAPHHDFVQWNGAAENKKTHATVLLVGTEHIGALGRNTGEVLGVFGEIDATHEPPITELKHYPNSAKRQNLIEIEKTLFTLWSPEWPADFPPIDPTLKASGKILYAKHCKECHELISDRKAPDRQVFAKLSDQKTDPTMAINFLKRKGKTGVLQGRRMEPLSAGPDTFGEEAPVALMLRHLVQRAVIRSKPEIIERGQAHVKTLFNELQASVDYQVSGQIGDEKSSLGGRFSFGGTHGVNQRVRDLAGRLLAPAEGQLETPVSQPEEIKLNYKARPLNGIWASAPYLHNNSIPNLDELLKTPEQRSKAVFKVGSRVYDVEKVGFKTDAGVDFDPTLKGNLNTGHECKHEDGRPFTDTERKQLIEYIKSL